MLGLKRLIRRRSSLRDSIVASQPEKLHYSLPSPNLARLTPKRLFDFYQLGDKEAIKKERARLNDEMNRGYFADMNEFKQHGGKHVIMWNVPSILPRDQDSFTLNSGFYVPIKIAVANKVIIPAMEAVKFPDIEVSFSDGKTMKLPIRISDTAVGSDKSSVPKASLVCLSFRASSQEMINSWSVPFVKTFSKSEDVHLYQVSFIDSWLLCRAPIKRFLLWTMKKPNHNESEGTLKEQMVYSFGDHYYFRKELKILNLLTGYIFLLDNFGRVRWQGFGLATEDELSSLLSCTSLLLNEQ